MKSKYLIMLLSLLIFFFVSFCFEVRCHDELANVWLILYVREYGTDLPIENISISVKLLTAWGALEGGQHVSDESGKIEVYLGKFAKANLLKSPYLTGLTLSNNYTLIKVNDVFLEDIDFSAQYTLKETQYSDMRVKVSQKISETDIFIKIDCWVLRGKLVAVSDSDPITGESSVISIKPAVKAVFRNGTYESFYLIPLNYEITISYISENKMGFAYPTLRLKVNENTSFINWMYYAALSYKEREMNSINEKIAQLNSLGLPLDLETKECKTLKNLARKVLGLYDKREYSAALNGMNLFVNRKMSLENWISNLKTLAVVGAICISLFAYGLSSIFSSFLFEEPAKNKERLVTKTLLFSSLMILFSLTNPSSKIACVMIIEKAINASIPEADLFTILLGTFVISTLIYFSIALISAKKSPVTNLALQLGIRSLKRRPFRTVLTLITIVIIVSSSIILINVSVSRGSEIKGSWPSTNISSLTIRSNPSALIKLSMYDMSWIKKQEWCSKITYMEEISQLESLGEGQIMRRSILTTEDKFKKIVNVIFVDPEFMNEYYNFSRYVRGFWKDFSRGKKVIILPTNYDIAIGDYVTLSVNEILMRGLYSLPLGTRELDVLQVIGKFDPSQLIKLKKMDNSSLFNDPANTVLIPIDAIKDSSVAISEINVIIPADFDPVTVAKEIAYSLGVPVIANKNGFSFLVEWSIKISVAGFIQYLVPIIIGGLMMYITMASVYEERKRELFTLATLGLDPHNTLLTFIIETLLFGLLGTFIGFFGSYILALAISHLSSLLGVTSPIVHINWSVFTIFVALFTGIVMTFLGGYIPSIKAQGLSLLGRTKIRELVGELMIEGDNITFTLPIRESLRNSELLYGYARETLKKLSLVDSHSIKGEIYGDGSFNISFVAIGPRGDVFIPCTLKGERDKDVLTLSVVFPRSYMEYEQIRRVLRDLEAYMIGFSAWRDMQLKMKIVREAPKKQKTMDEILEEVKYVMEQMKDFSKKLKILESQKERLTEEIYNEFRQKYLRMLEEKFKTLRSMTIGLEPYLSQIREEIKKINLEIERVTIAYNLGEINEEEYIKICSPMQNKLTMLKSKLKELEEIFDFLKKPMEMI